MRLAIIVVAAFFAGGCSSQGTPATGHAVHGEVVAKARCAACHGPDGNSSIAMYPRLAGMRASYLYGQLVSFRNGERPSAVMASIVHGLSNQDELDVSAFFAGQSRARDAAGPADLMAEGRQLFRLGASHEEIPACADCHLPGAGRMGSMGGMGMMMGTPGPVLYGQHAAYIQAQLRAFANGTRPTAVMHGIARALTARQVQAIAAYLAAHP
ncbi:c-type cytochrome [Dyella sp. A6]|uniref:c-type cytochrome n=1 Tax=Dyella aluminiiresistens TaxID=3069105 RepID=UPI002E766EEB|nr:c-type cytochrome [Dyella sp. A6]